MHEDTTTDSDGRVSTLFHETTTHLDPDVAGLIRGSIERGRIRRRRAATGIVAATAAAVTGLVVVAANLAPSVGGARYDPAGAPAGAGVSVPSPTSQLSKKPAKTVPSPVRTGPMGGVVADLPVKAADLPGLFARLHPGKVTAADERTGRIIDNGKEGQYAHFLWNGFTTTVGFAPFAGTPAERCRRSKKNGSAPALTCTKRPDGTVLMTWRHEGTVKEPGVCQSASLLTKNGYEIVILSYNTGRKLGPELAAEPPFSIAQLTTAVTSNVWF